MRQFGFSSILQFTKQTQKPAKFLSLFGARNNWRFGPSSTNILAFRYFFIVISITVAFRIGVIVTARTVWWVSFDRVLFGGAKHCFFAPPCKFLYNYLRVYCACNSYQTLFCINGDCKHSWKMENKIKRRNNEFY